MYSNLSLGSFTSTDTLDSIKAVMLEKATENIVRVYTITHDCPVNNSGDRGMVFLNKITGMIVLKNKIGLFRSSDDSVKWIVPK